MLGSGHGDADRLHAVVPGGVAQHPAPPTADVEQSHARLKAKLPADQIALGVLRRIQGAVRSLEAGTRVGHGGPKHQAVEVVPHVIVMQDRGRVPPFRVGLTPQPGFLARGSRTAAEQAQPAGRTDDAEPSEGHHAQLGIDPAQYSKGMDQVSFDLQVPRYVSASEAQLTRSVDDALQGRRAPQHDCCPASWFPEQAAIPEPYGQRRGVAQKCTKERRKHRRDGPDGNIDTPVRGLGRRVGFRHGSSLQNWDIFPSLNLTAAACHWRAWVARRSSSR
jgi:hypothetical protein